jgi:hypothetical protein
MWKESPVFRIEHSRFYLPWHFGGSRCGIKVSARDRSGSSRYSSRYSTWNQSCRRLGTEREQPDLGADPPAGFGRESFADGGQRRAIGAVAETADRTRTRSGSE